MSDEDDKLTGGWKAIIGISFLVGVIALAAAAMRSDPRPPPGDYDERISRLERELAELKTKGPGGGRGGGSAPYRDRDAAELGE